MEYRFRIPEPFVIKETLLGVFALAGQCKSNIKILIISSSRNKSKRLLISHLSPTAIFWFTVNEFFLFRSSFGGAFCRPLMIPGFVLPETQKKNLWKSGGKHQIIESGEWNISNILTKSFCCVVKIFVFWDELLCRLNTKYFPIKMKERKEKLYKEFSERSGIFRFSKINFGNSARY